MDLNDIRIYGFENATIALANEPLFSIEGPLGKVQLIETALLNLTNYPTLIATLTTKIRSFAFNMIENGSISSQLSSLMGIKYSYITGISKTTNLEASEKFGIDLFYESQEIEKDLLFEYNDNDFVVNDQNVLENFAKANNELFERNKDRIKYIIYSNIDNEYFTLKYDSDDDFEIVRLLSKLFKQGYLIIEQKDIVNKVYDDIKVLIKYDPDMLNSKNLKLENILLGPEFIVSFTQPALGMVYKIMEINDKPCIKFSEEKSKQSIPGFKNVTRLYDGDIFICDYLQFKDEEIPNEKVSA